MRTRRCGARWAAAGLALCIGLCGEGAGGEGPDPSDAVRSALAAFTNGDYEAAVAGYTQAIAADPRLAVAWLGRSMARLEKYWREDVPAKRANPELARALEDDCIQAMRLDPKALDAYRQLAGPPGEQHVATFSERIKTFAATHYIRAKTCIMENKAEEGLRLLDRAANLMPWEPTFVFARGFFFRRYGLLDRAIADFDEIERRHRASPNDKALAGFHQLAIVERGVAYREKGDLDKSLADLTEAVRLAPDNAAAFVAKGATHRCRWELDQAIADFGRALAIEPKSDDALYERGLAYATRGDHARALPDLTLAIRLNPKRSDAYYTRGYALLELSRADDGIADFDQALRLAPRFAACWLHRGRAYSAKGEWAKSIADLTEAIRLAPDQQSAYRLRARAYTQMGDAARAQADLAKLKALEQGAAPTPEQREK